MEKSIFLAFDLPRDTVKKIRKYYDFNLQFSWTRPENLHITLIFLGTLDQSQIEDVMKVCELVSARQPPVKIEYDKVYAKKYMIWAGVKTTSKLAKLYNDLEKTFFDREDLPRFAVRKDFTPHTNLARTKNLINSFEYPDRVVHDLSFLATHIVVFESILNGDFPRYLSLDAFELRGGKYG